MTSLFAALTLAGATTAPSSSSTNGGYGIDVVNADLAFAVNLLARSTGRDIVLDGSVPHNNITIAFERRNPDDAIRFFAKTQGLVIEHYGNADILIREQDEALRAPDQLTTRVVSLRNNISSTTLTTLQTFASSVQIASDPQSHTLVLRGPDDQVSSLKPIIEALDQPSFGQSLQTRLFNFSSGKPSDAVTAIEKSLGQQSQGTISSGGEGGAQSNQIIPNDAAGTIVAIGSLDYLNKVANLISNYDQYGKQVLYDVRIVELTPYNDSALLGVQTGGYGPATSSGTGGASTVGAALSAGSFGFGYAGNALKIFSQLDLMLEHGTATTISDPQILAQNNSTETLNATEQYPIITSSVSNGVTTGQVAYQPIGLVLKVTPTIANDGSVLTTISASYSAILGFTQTYPIIGQRETDGTFRVGNDETLVLSGLMQETDANTIDKLPGLGNIPLIGAFFRHQNETKNKDELVFLLTPHIKSAVARTSDTVPPFPIPSPVGPSYVDHQTVVPGLKPH
jgi:general secretion pathway protein D